MPGGGSSSSKAATVMKGSSPKANTKTAAKTKASSPKGGKKAPAMKVAAMTMKSAGGAMKKEAKPLEKAPFYLIKSEPLTRMEKGTTACACRERLVVR